MRAAGLFLIPSFLGFLGITFVPLLASIVLAFTDCQMLTDDIDFIGLDNFTKLLGGHRNAEGAFVPNDPDFWYYLYNTGFLMLAIPLSMAASLALALLVNNKLRGILMFRALYFLPSLTAGVAVFMVWRLMFQTDNGMINQALRLFGVPGPDWLNSSFWAKPAIMLMSVCTAAGGYNMIIYLAGLQNIPLELYEAAEVDGAGPWQRFRHITWPMLAPTTFFIFTMSMIAGFQGGFEAAFIMTNGGPAGSTKTISFYIYDTAYKGQLLMGYGCAIAWVLFVLVLTVTLFNWRYGNKSATEGWMS
jgi:multiple sugar transport system permease protein